MTINQSNFKFNLKDFVIIAKPTGLSESLRGTIGFITHRGYHDSTTENYANLYALITDSGNQINGIPEIFLELEEK